VFEAKSRYQPMISARQTLLKRVTGLLCLFCVMPLSLRAQVVPQLVQINTAQLWQRLEFRISNVRASSNPFDPNAEVTKGALSKLFLNGPAMSNRKSWSYLRSGCSHPFEILN